MPAEAIKLGAAQMVMNIEEIVSYISKMAGVHV
jgi:hypothetical protein